MRVCKIGLGCGGVGGVGSWGGCTLYRRLGALRPDNKGGVFANPSRGLSIGRTPGQMGHIAVCDQAMLWPPIPPLTGSLLPLQHPHSSMHILKSDLKTTDAEIFSGGEKAANGLRGIRSTEFDDTCKWKRQPKPIRIQNGKQYWLGFFIHIRRNMLYIYWGYFYNNPLNYLIKHWQIKNNLQRAYWVLKKKKLAHFLAFFNWV